MGRRQGIVVALLGAGLLPVAAAGEPAVWTGTRSKAGKARKRKSAPRRFYR